MDNNEKLSAERSLKIISETIEQSRTDIMRNAGMPMIFWGILTCITSVAVCYLWQATDNPSWNALWFLMAVIGWSVTAAKSRKDKKKAYKLLQQSAQNIMDIFRSVCTHNSRHRHAFV